VFLCYSSVILDSFACLVCFVLPLCAAVLVFCCIAAILVVFFFMVCSVLVCCVLMFRCSGCPVF